MELEHVYNVFHISQLRKYIPDPNHAIVAEPIEATSDLVYEESPVQILHHTSKQLRDKQIPLAKVLWSNQTFSEATWETKEEMKAKHRHLFEVVLYIMETFVSFEDETL